MSATVATTGSTASSTATAARAVRRLGVDRIDEVEGLWRSFETRMPDLPIMRSWAWTSAWVHHYADVLRCSFVVVEEDGDPVAIALVVRGVRRYGPVRIRSLWIGTANLPADDAVSPECNGAVVLPGHEQAAAEALLADARRRRDWDELRLHGMFEHDLAPYVERWPAARTRTERLPAPYLDLSGLGPDDDAAAAITSGSARRRTRTSVRAMERHGTIATAWASTAEETLSIFDELVELHQARWTDAGLPGLFGPTRFGAFHRELAPQLVERGRAVAFRATVDGETIGCLYHFRDGDRLRFYQSGFSRTSDNRLRPGIVTHVLCMEEARRRGIATYDFLSGDVRYKRQLSNGAGEVLRVALRRRRLRLALYDLGVRVRDRRAAAEERDGAADAADPAAAGS